MNRIVWCFLPLLLTSCGSHTSIHYTDETDPQKRYNNVDTLDSIKFISCTTSYDTFGQLYLNGFNISNIRESNFLKKYPNYDSILYDAKYYYGKSFLIFDKNRIVEFLIVDTNLNINNLIMLNSTLEFAKEKYPCSYKNKSTGWTNDTSVITLRLFDSKFNDLLLNFKNNKLFQIIFSEDEPESD